MASLLSLLGGSSGTPFTLTDEEQQQLADQQAQMQDTPTNGVSALMGVTGQDSTSQDAQPVADATRQGLLGAIGKGDSANTGSDANPSYATDSQKADDAAAATAQQDATDASSASSDTPAASTDTPSTDNSTASSSTSAPASADDGSQRVNYLRSLLHNTLGNPNFGQSLMAAGFGAMAHSNYGTSGISAVGQGAEDGMKTYQALKQQQIANNLAAYQAQNKNAMDQADIASKNATTQQTLLANASKKSLMAYAAKAGTNFSIPDAIAAGALPQDAISAYQGLHPELTMNTDDAGNVYAFNKQTGANTKIGNTTKIVNTAAGTTSTAYSGTGGNGAPNSTVVQEGGLPPEAVQKAVAEPQAAQAAAVKSSQMQSQMLSQLQSAAALAGSGGGVLGAGWRAAQAKLGMDDSNSALRQQFAATNVQGIVSALPSGSRMDQNFLQQMEKTVTDPQTATPTQMIKATAFLKSKADYDAVENEAKAAYISQNGGQVTPNKKAMTITVGGQSMNVPAGTPLNKVTEAATSKLVDWDPALVNPKWGDGRSQADIDQAMAFAKQSPANLKKMRDAGILLPSNMRTGG
ncbi:hypothetical protein [Paraburkholderia graminis]